MKRIRFHYGCTFAGTDGYDGYDDILVEDDTDDTELDQQAEEIMNEAIAPGYHWEEIDDDDEDWEGE